jgi:hypothetical protein
MHRTFRAWSVLTLNVLVPLSVLALPVSAFAQRSSGGGQTASSGGQAASGGGHATSGGGGHVASSGGGTSSGGGSTARGGGSGSGGGRATAARAWSGGSNRNSSGATQARTTSARRAVTGTPYSAGRAALSDRISEKDGGIASVPPYSRPRTGSPVGPAVPRGSVAPPIGGGTTLIPGYYGYPGGWGYGYYGYGDLAGMGLFDDFGGYGGFGGFGGFDSLGYGYSRFGSLGYGPGYGSAYGTYDPYASTSASFTSSGPDSTGVFISSSREAGALRLKVKPDKASVYLDGESAGLVNQYDGLFQKLRLDGGNHRVEIRAPGYRTLTFNVRIEPDHTETYRGELEKEALKK